MSKKIYVIGDYILDVDMNFTQNGIAPDYHCPIVIEKNSVARDGGAGAVVSMCQAMGVLTTPICPFIKQRCTKRRIFIDNKCIMRQDVDHLKSITKDQEDIIISNLVRQADANNCYIIISDYGKGVITERLYKQLVDLGYKLLVDPARSRSLSFYAGAYAIFPNRVEACITENDLEINAAVIACNSLQHFYSNIVIKLGANGCVVCYDKNITHIKGEKINVVDVCGAGDMFISAAAVALCYNATFLQACEFANEMAAKKCEQIGATPVYVDYSTRLRQNIQSR